MTLIIKMKSDLPFIGITCWEREFPPSNFVATGVYLKYVDAIRKAGGLPIFIPTQLTAMEISRYCGLISGCLIPGGEDVSPKFYNEEPTEYLKLTSEVRDESEINFVKACVASQIPLLGICRGM